MHLLFTRRLGKKQCFRNGYHTIGRALHSRRAKAASIALESLSCWHFPIPHLHGRTSGRMHLLLIQAFFMQDLSFNTIVLRKYPSRRILHVACFGIG